MTPTAAASLMCNPAAIPAVECAVHQALVTDLFQNQALSTIELADGYEVRFPAFAFDALSRFIGNERRCCPAFSFEIAIPPEGADLRLRLRGPAGTREFLAANLPQRLACCVAAAAGEGSCHA